MVFEVLFYDEWIDPPSYLLVEEVGEKRRKKR